MKPDKTRLPLSNVDHNPSNEDINLENVSRTLLRIVAQLPKSEYHFSKSNGQNRRQADEHQLTNLPNPARDNDTTQG